MSGDRIQFELGIFTIHNRCLSFENKGTVSLQKMQLRLTIELLA
jgi:hypothetical protein